MDISVIYPLHITFSNLYVLERIQWCLTNTHKNLPEAEHIIVLSGNKYLKQKATEKLKPYNNIKILSDYTPTNPYSPGTARNHGVKNSTKNNLLFWDIDLLGSEELFTNVKHNVLDQQKPDNAFSMYPCLYLTSIYSKKLKKNLSKNINTQSLLLNAYQSATSLEVNSIEHFAMATSTILCNKKHFLKIGSFDESFIGHMGEDLELLNRLYLNKQTTSISPSYSVNKSSKIPNELQGFRQHFAGLSLPYLKSMCFTVHLHHNTRNYSKYKKPQKQNTQLLESKITLSVNNTSRCEKNTPNTEHSFGEEPYLNKQPLITMNFLEKFSRKTKKLFKSPSAFFKDINC